MLTNKKSLIKLLKESIQPDLKQHDASDNIINPSLTVHSKKFKSFKRLKKEIKQSTKFTGTDLSFPIDTTHLNDEHHNEFGKKLCAPVSKHINDGTNSDKLTETLLCSVSVTLGIEFLMAEYPVASWIQSKKDLTTTYLLRGSIDAVVWHEELQQFMIVEWKAKPNVCVDYWSKKGQASPFWSVHFPQTLAYARALRCQLNLDYEPKIIVVACSREMAYPRLIESYGKDYYRDKWSWFRDKPNSILYLPSSILQKDTILSADSPLSEVFSGEATLSDLLSALHIDVVKST